MHGLVVGRFQPVHNGHVQLIRRAIEDCVHVTVVIGSSTEPVSIRNPFSFEEREAMLRVAFGDQIQVIGVPDLHDPPRYAAHVLGLTGPVDHVFGNDERTLDLFEDDGHRVVRPGLVDRERLEGSTVRAWMAEGDPAWRKSVPKTVANYLDSIEASKRLARLE